MVRTQKLTDVLTKDFAGKEFRRSAVEDSAHHCKVSASLPLFTLVANARLFALFRGHSRLKRVCFLICGSLRKSAAKFLATNNKPLQADDGSIQGEV